MVLVSFLFLFPFHIRSSFPFFCIRNPFSLLILLFIPVITGPKRMKDRQLHDDDDEAMIWEVRMTMASIFPTLFPELATEASSSLRLSHTRSLTSIFPSLFIV